MSRPDPTLPLFARAAAQGDRVAIVDAAGEHSYAELLEASARVAAGLLAGRADLEEARVAFFVPPSFEWVATLWGIWRAGGVAVPLALSHPPAELRYTIGDSEATILISDPASSDFIGSLADRPGVRHATTAELLAAVPGNLPSIAETRRALMIYTSGTTGKPKGVVTTHTNLRAQITALVEAWEWSPEDRALLVLPLHHVHGIVNVVLCALWAGAVCEMLPRFTAEEAWARLATGRLTLFTAVPTVFRRLQAAWEAAPEATRAMWTAGCRSVRVMMSGSAALPVALLEQWREISGHTLLERYGMTELGMALANPLHGVRRPGYVGTPVPGVAVRVVNERGTPVSEGAPGELEVRGANVFLEYWHRPEETRAAFRDGWFRTGDTAVLEGGSYRLLGRSNVDIIKTGGFKVSALEIEEELRTHPAIAECAVVGVEDSEYGERICVAVELSADTGLTLEELQRWARERLAPYKLPRALSSVAALPRNAMGKVLKPEVAKLFKQ
jgi:malonyl-CoA/methylmalonyl-CoA synthetase